jgi:hypothetical protein
MMNENTLFHSPIQQEVDVLNQIIVEIGNTIAQ